MAIGGTIARTFVPGMMRGTFQSGAEDEEAEGEGVKVEEAEDEEAEDEEAEDEEAEDAAIMASEPNARISLESM